MSITVNFNTAVFDMVEETATDGDYTYNRLEMTVSNSNWARIANSLGLPCDQSFGDWDAQAVIDAIKSYRPGLANRPATEEVGAKGAKFYDGGISEEYMTHKLDLLLEIAEGCAEKGIPVSWG